jgi:protein-S-isoprenylcysteine O-methyltransferase Ste14
MFLPTFGYFAGYMFFLAGLGLMRAIWLPFWGMLMKLGDIAMVPYMAIVYPLAKAGLDVRYVRRYVAYASIGLGLLIFFLGTLTWLFARFRRKGTADIWLYRFSRHPQYLGWIIWSYGLMLLAAQAPIPLGGENPGASLPWAISSLVIVWVALGEEIRMSRQRGGEYETYRAKAPFMIPLPRLVTRVITAPLRLVLRKERPEKGSELVITFLVYTVIVVLLSLPFVLLEWPPGPGGWMDWPSFRPPPVVRPREYSLQGCQTECNFRGYLDAACLPQSEAGPGMVDVGGCSTRSAGTCGESDDCRCFCSREMQLPAGALSVGDLLEERRYGTEVSIYGQVRMMGEFRCPCFYLFSQAEDITVWYDGMLDEDGSRWPAVDIAGIENGDWVVITGEMRPEGESESKGVFWASSIERVE